MLKIENQLLHFSILLILALSQSECPTELNYVPLCGNCTHDGQCSVGLECSFATKLCTVEWFDTCENKTSSWYSPYEGAGCDPNDALCKSNRPDVNANYDPAECSCPNPDWPSNWVDCTGDVTVTVADYLDFEPLSPGHKCTGATLGNFASSRMCYQHATGEAIAQNCDSGAFAFSSSGTCTCCSGGAETYESDGDWNIFQQKNWGTDDTPATTHAPTVEPCTISFREATCEGNSFGEQECLSHGCCQFHGGCSALAEEDVSTDAERCCTGESTSSSALGSVFVALFLFIVIY